MILSKHSNNNNRCALVLGGIGSGKRFIIVPIVNTLLAQHNQQTRICVPTGKTASNINRWSSYSNNH